MSPNAAHILVLFGFEELPPHKSRPQVTRWHYARTLPQCYIELPANATPHDIRDALVNYGSVLPITKPVPETLLDNEGAPLIEPTSGN